MVPLSVSHPGLEYVSWIEMEVHRKVCLLPHMNFTTRLIYNPIMSLYTVTKLILCRASPTGSRNSLTKPGSAVDIRMARTSYCGIWKLPKNRRISPKGIDEAYALRRTFTPSSNCPHMQRRLRTLQNSMLTAWTPEHCTLDQY